MRKLLQFLLRKPITWLVNHFTGAPQKNNIFKALKKLYLPSAPATATLRLPFTTNEKFIIFSDHHKGAKNGADDFWNNEPIYVKALNHYNQNNYQLILLGDVEELWENKIDEVLLYNQTSINHEQQFAQRSALHKVFGNHDIFWKLQSNQTKHLANFTGATMPVFEAIILQHPLLNLFCTHGHQGDTLSDNNPTSAWFVANIWAPLQRYLKLNPNQLSKDDLLKNKHNKIMHQWAASQKNTVLITGHTHKPVFASGVFSNHPNNQIGINNITKPVYFNTGCCCFNDGDITGIEITFTEIALVKWHAASGQKIVLETTELKNLVH
jgi:predicted phosphodiesterase